MKRIVALLTVAVLAVTGAAAYARQRLHREDGG
jgi:hypothetical protein